MTTAAGLRVRGGDAGFAMQTSSLSSTYNVTNSEADTGLTVTFSTSQDNINAIVLLTAYASINVTSTTHLLTCYCNVDGTNDSRGFYILTPSVTSLNGLRGPFTRHWPITLASAGNHTIKIRAVCTTSSDFSLQGTHTTMTAYAVP
jgi:hypothetical protein